MISLKNTSNPFNISDNELEKILKFMCGRMDFYWEYKNGVPFMTKEELTPDKLNLHFIGGNALGFSPFIDNDKVMFIGWDFDAHTSSDLTDEENNKLIEDAKNDAVLVYNFLRNKGLAVILNSSGSKGRHVRLYCEGANAQKMRVYGHYVLWKLFGDIHKHEVFPKQDRLSEQTPYGNQMKGYLCVHPKHKKRANIIAGDRILDFENSLKVIEMTLEGGMGILKMDTEDYETVKQLMKGKNAPSFNPGAFTLSNSGSVNIPRCNFIEQIATKFVLPSKNKYSRHTCIDPNIQAYSYLSPASKIKYAKMQGRNSDTAFRNWEHYWNGGKPSFNCGQIISYLKNHNDNDTCKKGLKFCEECKHFKEHKEKRDKPFGLANNLLITQVATQNNFRHCPVCKASFIFDDIKGLWYCKNCKKGGSLKKLLKVILFYKKKQEAIN